MKGFRPDVRRMSRQSIPSDGKGLFRNGLRHLGERMKIVCAYSGGRYFNNGALAEGKVRCRDHPRPYGSGPRRRSSSDKGQKALHTGASAAVVDDLRERFVTEFIWPALQAGTLYEGAHTHSIQHWVARSSPSGCVRSPMNTVRMPLPTAVLEKGMIRFDLKWPPSVSFLLKVLAPLREWELTTRELEIEYALARNIEIPITLEKPYSIDENIWGCAIECGEMEDLWTSRQKMRGV